MAKSEARSLPIPVGFQYRHVATGKEWVVTGLRPGGVCEISAVGRYVTGEMYTRDIRAILEDGTSERMELTDAARAVLRRCRA